MLFGSMPASPSSSATPNAASLFKVIKEPTLSSTDSIRLKDSDTKSNGEISFLTNLSCSSFTEKSNKPKIFSLLSLFIVP